jgi:DNA-binding transcriptional LysR family regulator
MLERNYQELARLLPVLPILAELGSTGHITETAELLGIPQSTVSRALARAAAVVGTDLVVREGRGIRLTPAAEVLIPRVQAALAQVQNGLDEVRLQADQTRGRISVAFQHTFGEATLPLMIREFRLRHPAVTFELIQGSRSLCLDSLAQARVDLAIISPVPRPTRSLGAQLLYAEPLRLVVPEQHPFAARQSIRLEEARAEGFVVLSEGFGLRSIFDALCRQAGFRPRITFEGQDSHTLRGLVSAGLGISVLAPSGADHLTPAASPLGWKELVIEAPLAQREIGLAWRMRDGEPEQVRRFRELVLGEGRPLLQRAFAGTD